MSREISRLLELFLSYEEDLYLKMLILKRSTSITEEELNRKQIRSLIQLAYKIERQAAGLKDTLGGLPSREASQFRSHVPEYCYSLDEEGICKIASELIFAFDEVICLGHKDNVAVAYVKQYYEMESHEEKLHKLVLQSKINETKDVMKRNNYSLYYIHFLFMPCILHIDNFGF
ncbi:hypothetical protein V6N11_034444 [Hibiscus sabdariffa]|uniref:Coatomer subunit delta n=1 Tax=Hibiscus sabdariffa TaxID=183260 RepID=A0ABR2NMJ2_9ROSI